jgi:hypothetical protein
MRLIMWARGRRSITAVSVTGVFAVLAALIGTAPALAGATPALAGPGASSHADSALSGVSCTSASACTAVGTYGTASSTSSTTATLAERWNGSTWKVQPTRAAIESALSGVSCPSATVCIAAGGYSDHGVIERWNGTTWTIHAFPKANRYLMLNGVSCTSATACTAAGSIDHGPATDNLAERWNGSTWKMQAMPNPASEYSAQDAVSCGSATACIAVGGYIDNPGHPGHGGAGILLAEGWNGTTWKIQSIPNPAH